MEYLPKVEIAPAAAREKIINTIVLGFVADPLTRWLINSATDYLSGMPEFMNAFGGRAFEEDTAFVAGDGKAAALWLPPGVEPDQETMVEVMMKLVRPEQLEDLGAILEGMSRFHPEEPHWYLPVIAADPAFTGQGLGAALMKSALVRCDEDRMPAYLESSNPRNISLYERHGFEIIGRIQSGESPVMTPMYRPART